MSSTGSISTSFSEKALLSCGILASLLYIAVLVFIPLMWQGYSTTSQTVSELWAIGAPTRTVWVPLGIIYFVLMAAFGWGIWKTADLNHPLRLAGGTLLVFSIIGLFCPPMHQREALAAGGKSLTDTFHLIFTFVTVALMFIALVFGAMSYGKRFRYYSVATILILLVFGAITGFYSSNVSANQPTPLLGIWERISIGAFLLWVMVLSVKVLRGEEVIE